MKQMKFILIYVAFLLSLIMILLWVIGRAEAEPMYWVDSNSVEISWDVVTRLDTNQPVPTGHEIKYNVYAKDKKEAEIFLGLVTETHYIFEVKGEGRFTFGVQSVRYDIELEEEINTSQISWSTDEFVVLDRKPFGLKCYIKPKKTKNLKIRKR